MPVQSYFDPTEITTLQHPLTGEDIAVTDREALVKAYSETESELRKRRTVLAEVARSNQKIIDFLVGAAALRRDAIRWAKETE